MARPDQQQDRCENDCEECEEASRDFLGKLAHAKLGPMPGYPDPFSDDETKGND